MLPGGIPKPQSFQPLPRLHRRPAVESWTLTVEQVEHWYKAARTGEVLVYAHGPSLIPGGAGARVRELIGTREAIPLPLVRAVDGGFDYRVARNRIRLVVDRRDSSLTPLAEAILERIEHAAAAGERCPSDSALGRAFNVTTDQAKWALRTLTQSGRIRTRMMPTRTEPRFRIVEVLASGKQTAGPGGAL